jgi:hypothetical protein
MLAHVKDRLTDGSKFSVVSAEEMANIILTEKVVKQGHGFNQSWLEAALAY